MRNRRTIILNPARKPVSGISDRAKRYRANLDIGKGPKRCGYCGSVHNLGVDHIDGIEDHGEPGNLIWACKSCNGKKASVLKNAGLGRRVSQTNKARGRSRDAISMQQYGNAIKVMRGEFEGNVQKAVDTIRSAPASLRSAYSSRAWTARKQKYGPSGRADGGAVPF